MTLTFCEYRIYPILRICAKELSGFYTIIANFIPIFSYTFRIMPAVVEGAIALIFELRSNNVLHFGSVLGVHFTKGYLEIILHYPKKMFKLKIYSLLLPNNSIPVD